MGRFIVELAPGQFVYWSSVVDAPITCVMTEFELTQFIREEEGKEGVLALPERWARVQEKGTSALTYPDAASVIACNRAGPGETHISREKILQDYAQPEVP